MVSPGGDLFFVAPNVEAGINFCTEAPLIFYAN